MHLKYSVLPAEDMLVRIKYNNDCTVDIVRLVPDCAVLSGVFYTRKSIKAQQSTAS